MNLLVCICTQSILTHVNIYIYIYIYIYHIKRTQTEGVQELSVRKIPGPKREDANGSWSKLHKEELHYLPSSPNVKEIK
jgi:hypothetical protein